MIFTVEWDWWATVQSDDQLPERYQHSPVRIEAKTLDRAKRQAMKLVGKDRKMRWLDLNEFSDWEPGVYDPHKLVRLTEPVQLREHTRRARITLTTRRI